MRRLTASCLSLLIVLSLFIFSAAAASLKVTVRGTPVVWSGSAPYINEQNVTLTPVRDVTEAMGLTVRWVQSERMVELSRTYTPSNSVYQAELQSGQKEFIFSRTMRLWIGRNTFTVSNQYAISDGQSITKSRTGQTSGTMTAAPVLRNNQTFVAIRPVAEQFGFDVIWDQTAQTVRIVNGLASDWSYAWSVTANGDGALLVGVHSPVNLRSARITGVSVRCTTDPSTSDGVCSFRAATSQEDGLIQEAAGTSAQVLDAVRVDYPFTAGESYTITLTLAMTKSNGASATASGSFQVTLPADGSVLAASALSTAQSSLSTPLISGVSFLAKISLIFF